MKPDPLLDPVREVARALIHYASAPDDAKSLLRLVVHVRHLRAQLARSCRPTP